MWAVPLGLALPDGDKLSCAILSGVAGHLLVALKPGRDVVLRAVAAAADQVGGDAAQVGSAGGKAGGGDALNLGPGLAQPVGAAGGAGDDFGGELKAAFGS